MTIELSKEQIDIITSWYECTQNEWPTSEEEDNLAEYLYSLLDE